MKFATIFFFLLVFLGPLAASEPKTQDLLAGGIISIPAIEQTVLTPSLVSAGKHYAAGEHEKALSSARRVRLNKESSGTERHQALLIESVSLLGLNRGNTASRRLALALSQRRSSSDALYLSSLVSLESDSLQQAEATLREALWFDRFQLIEAAEAHLLLAAIYNKGGKAALSAEHLRLALKKNDNHVPAKLALAEHHLKEGKTTEAVALYRQILRQESTHGLARLNLARILVNTHSTSSLGREAHQEALKLSTSIVMETPKEELRQHAVLPVHLRALLLNDRVDEAEALLKSGLAKSPNNPELKRLARQMEMERKVRQE